MKKGFFLLEALLACTLILLLVGAIMHHHAQWSLCYKRSMDRDKALAELSNFIEQGETTSYDYIITQKTLSVPAPESTNGMHYPPAECTQVTVSWRDTDGGPCAISIVVGTHEES